MIQLTAVTTLFGAASAAAAIDAGLLGDPDERVLVIANNAPIPEVVRSLADTPGAEAVLSRFDRVVDLGALLHPQTPSRWKVFAIDLPAQERLLRSYFELGDAPVELVVESVHVPPAETLTKVFNSARITILSEGLMSFGPTRNPQSHTFGQRLDGMVYLDLVEGLDPLLLSEHGISSQAIAPEHFRRIIEEICATAKIPTVEDPAPTALVLGQYLAALRLITPQQETRMQVDMLKAAKTMGAERVLFKPHPSAPATNTAALVAAAGKEGLTIELVDAGLSAEAVMATHRLVGVVAGFSTALATAQRVFGLPTRCIGTRVMFDALDPYQNSNRIPVTIIDFLHRHADREDAIEELRRLTVAVAYTMQPDSLAARRDEVVAYLERLAEAERTRYITQGRLTKLGLPGGKRPMLPPQVSKVAHDAMERVPPGVAKSVYGSWRKLANARHRKP